MANESSRFRVLVVDDEREILELVSDVLAECGWDVVALDSPQTALRRMKREQFDALLLDLYMPEMPGLLMHAKARLIDRELTGRTVFMTGHFSREEVRRDMQASALVLMKPFEVNDLVGALTRVLPDRPRAAASP